MVSCSSLSTNGLLLLRGAASEELLLLLLLLLLHRLLLVKLPDNTLAVGGAAVAKSDAASPLAAVHRHKRGRRCIVVVGCVVLVGWEAQQRMHAQRGGDVINRGNWQNNGLTGGDRQGDRWSGAFMKVEEEKSMCHVSCYKTGQTSRQNE
jgi:hypothetical protein